MRRRLRAGLLIDSRLVGHFIGNAFFAAYLAVDIAWKIGFFQEIDKRVGTRKCFAIEMFEDMQGCARSVLPAKIHDFASHNFYYSLSVTNGFVNRNETNSPSIPW